MITNFTNPDKHFIANKNDNICRPSIIDSNQSYIDNFGGSLPDWLKDLATEVNISIPAPNDYLAADVDFGNFLPSELSSNSKLKSDKIRNNGKSKGVGSKLGTITKSNSAQSQQGTDKVPQYIYSSFTPSRYEYNFPKGTADFKEEGRSVRYKLLMVSKHILAQNPKFNRVQNCLSARINKMLDVTILKHNAHNCLHYGNLMRCGSVWLCPVCSAKVTEVRRLELQLAKRAWEKAGGYVYFLTLTTPHYSFTDLDMLLKGQAKALKYLWGGREAEALKADLGIEGQIRAFEVTQSDINGFHPHYHILLFSKIRLDLDIENFKRVEAVFKRKWAKSCVKAGLPEPSYKNGATLQDGSHAFKYISKFGLDDKQQSEMRQVVQSNGGALPEFDGMTAYTQAESPNGVMVKTDELGNWNSSHEMTKSHSKKGKKESLTPFDFLRNYNDDPQKYGHLFQVYATATKGKAQLFWSRGLRKKLGLGEVTDTDIASNGNVSELVGDNNDLAIINSTDKNSELVYSIETTDWALVRKSRLQYTVLALAKDNIKLLDDLFSILRKDENDRLMAIKNSLPPPPKKTIRQVKAEINFNDMTDKQKEIHKKREKSKVNKLIYSSPTDVSFVDIDNCYEVYNKFTNEIHYVSVIKRAVAPCEEEDNKDDKPIFG